jgi:hypothetical protein
MRRKPSASHCVKKPPPEVYRPESWLFLAGAQVLRISSVKGCPGRLSMTSWPSSWRNETQAQRLGRHGRVAFDLHAADHQRLGRIEVEREVDTSDPVDRGAVFLPADDGGGAFTHGGLLS